MTEYLHMTEAACRDGGCLVMTEYLHMTEAVLS